MNGTSPGGSATETELTEREADDGREKAKRGGLDQEQEASSLRARRAELAERLEAARTALASARERREFMEEEAEQVCVGGEDALALRCRLTSAYVGLSVVCNIHGAYLPAIRYPTPRIGHVLLYRRCCCERRFVSG